MKKLNDRLVDLVDIVDCITAAAWFNVYRVKAKYHQRITWVAMRVTRRQIDKMEEIASVLEEIREDIR